MAPACTRHFWHRIRFTTSMISMSPWRCMSSRVGTVVDRLQPGHWASMWHSGQSER